MTVKNRGVQCHVAGCGIVARGSVSDLDTFYKRAGASDRFSVSCSRIGEKDN